MKSRRGHLQEEEKENMNSPSKSMKTPRTPRGVKSVKEIAQKSESSRRTRNTNTSETKTKKGERVSLPTRKSARFLKLVDNSSEDLKSEAENAGNSTFTYDEVSAEELLPSDEIPKATRTPKPRKSRKRAVENAPENAVEQDTISKSVNPKEKSSGEESQDADGDGTFLVGPETIKKPKSAKKSKAHSKNRKQKKNNSDELELEAETTTQTSDEEASQLKVKNTSVKSSKKRRTRNPNSKKVLDQQDEDKEQGAISASPSSECESPPQEMESEEIAFKANVTCKMQSPSSECETPPQEMESEEIAFKANVTCKMQENELENAEGKTNFDQEHIVQNEIGLNVSSEAMTKVDSEKVEVEQHLKDSSPTGKNVSLEATNFDQGHIVQNEIGLNVSSEAMTKVHSEKVEVEQHLKDSSPTRKNVLLEARNFDQGHIVQNEIGLNVSSEAMTKVGSEKVEVEQHLKDSSPTGKNVSLLVNTTKDLTPALEDLEQFFDDKTINTTPKNKSSDECSLICQMDESVISVDSFASIISIPETPTSQKRDLPKSTPFKSPIISAKKAVLKPKSLTNTPVSKWSNIGSISKGVKRLQTPCATPSIDQNRSIGERDKTPFRKGGINPKGSAHSAGKLSNKKLALIVKEVQTPKIVPAESKVLKSIRKRSMSFTDVELKSAAKSKVTFHSPSNLTVPIEDIDKSLMVYQKSASKPFEHTSPNRKRTFSVSQISSGGKNLKMDTSPNRKRTFSVSQISSGGKNLKMGTSPNRKRALSVSQMSSGGKNLKIGASGETPSKVKKLEKQPSRTKMPNFSAIHQQNFDKMESIFDHIKKKQERAKALSATKTKSDSLHQSSKKFDMVIKGNKKENEVNSKARQKINLTHITVDKKDSAQQMDVTTHPKNVLKPISVPNFDMKDNSQLKETTKSSTEVLKPVAEALLPVEGIVKPSVETPKPAKVAVVKPMINPEKKVDKVAERRKKHESMLKSRTKNADGTLNQNVEFVKGIRSNRRFELQMLHRNKQ